MKIRLDRDVHGDFPIGHNTIARAGVYKNETISVNEHGAVSVRAENGEWLGIKPDEMEVIEEDGQ